jgi:hypothetical protein
MPNGKLAQAITKGQSQTFFPVAGQYYISQQPEPGHIAIDIAARAGTPIVAPRRGTVTYVGQMPSGYGIYIKIQDALTGLEEVFAHLLPGSVRVRPGERVSGGELLGQIGVTGRTSGAHLHFEVNPIGPEVFAGQRTDVRAVDPWSFLRGARPAQVTTRQLGATSSAASALSGKPTTVIGSAPQSSIGQLTGQATQQAKAAQQTQQATQRGVLEQVGRGLVAETATRTGLSWNRVIALALGVLLMVVGLFMVSQSARETAMEKLTNVIGGAAGAVPEGAAVKAAVGAAAGAS